MCKQNKAIYDVKSFLNHVDADDKNGLYVFSSGVRVPAEVVKRCYACSYHRERPERDVHQRAIIGKKTSFSDPIKNPKLKTMAEANEKGILLSSCW